MPIFSTISLVSFLSKSRGRPKNVMVQSGVKAQTNEVIAPPKRRTPAAVAATAISFVSNAMMSFGPGKNALNSATDVGETGIGSCLIVGTRNPSSACPANPFPEY